jgi:iron(III) transport system ATP-binding protein
MSELLFTLEKVSMPGRAAARLEKISLHISSGITAILGASGAGKTTLCNLLVEFETPNSGRMISHWKNQSHQPTSERLPLYWSPDGGLWPHLNVAAHLAAVMPTRAKHHANDLLEKFALEHCINALPAQLSAGERERLGVARAIASEAKVLVLDEPFAHVDGVAAAHYWRTLLSLVQANDSSLIYTTHAPERVIGYAQTVICLRDGRMLHHGAVDELYHRPPTFEAATCLGATNWLSAKDRATWFPDSDTNECIRPERIIIEPLSTGAAVVQTAEFHGHLASVEVLRDDGQRRTFLHRPSRPLLFGERVSVTLRPGPQTEPRTEAAFNTSHVHRLGNPLMMAMFMLIIAAMTMSGCTNSSADSTAASISFSSEKTWNLPPVAATQPAPRGLGKLGDDQVMVLDTAGRVLVYDGAGTLVRQWKMPAFDVGRPEGVVQLKDGRIAVADTHYHRVVLFDANGMVSSMIGGPNEDKGPGGFLYPVGVATDLVGNLYVSEYGGNDRVQKFSPDGKLLATCGQFGTAPGSFQRPQGLAWHDGRLYIADAMNNRVQIFSDDGKFISVLGGEHPPELHFPYNAVVGPDGNLTVVEYSGGRITRLTLDGTLLGRYGKPGSGDGQFSTPWGMTVDGKGRVWVADTGNRRLVELTP